MFYNIELILIFVYLTKPLLASDECSDETPWFCEDNTDFDEPVTFRSLTGVQFKTISHNKSEIDGPIPEEFDARKAWPQCKSISRITSQGSCGICWAICSSSVMSDRICISTGGRDQVEISINDLVTCCKDCTRNSTHKCSGGGKVIRGFIHLIETGIVSSKCKSFDLKKLKTPNVPCERTCTNNSKIDYNKDKRRGFYMLTNIPSITMTDVFIELMRNNGPLCVGLRNFGDNFIHDYKKGVFIDPRNSSFRRKHAARLIGWGTEGGIPYWLLANSWGTKWGDKGFFKVRRGTNELEIERRFAAVGIKPLENEEVEHQISSSQYIQPWNFILYSMYSMTKEFFCLVMLV